MVEWEKLSSGLLTKISRPERVKLISEKNYETKVWENCHEQRYNDEKDDGHSGANPRGNRCCLFVPSDWLLRTRLCSIDMRVLTARTIRQYTLYTRPWVGITADTIPQWKGQHLRDSTCMIYKFAVCSHSSGPGPPPKYRAKNHQVKPTPFPSLPYFTKYPRLILFAKPLPQNLISA